MMIILCLIHSLLSSIFSKQTRPFSLSNNNYNNKTLHSHSFIQEKLPLRTLEVSDVDVFKARGILTDPKLLVKNNSEYIENRDQRLFSTDSGYFSIKTTCTSFTSLYFNLTPGISIIKEKLPKDLYYETVMNLKFTNLTFYNGSTDEFFFEFLPVEAEENSKEKTRIFIEKMILNNEITDESSLIGNYYYLYPDKPVKREQITVALKDENGTSNKTLIFLPTVLNNNLNLVLSLLRQKNYGDNNEWEELMCVNITSVLSYDITDCDNSDLSKCPASYKIELIRDIPEPPKPEPDPEPEPEPEPDPNPPETGRILTTTEPPETTAMNCSTGKYSGTSNILTFPIEKVEEKPVISIPNTPEDKWNSFPIALGVIISLIGIGVIALIIFGGWKIYTIRNPSLLNDKSSIEGVKPQGDIKQKDKNKPVQMIEDKSKINDKQDKLPDLFDSKTDF